MELEINGQKADIKDSVIAISRSVIDIENLSIRKIDITNRFDLPKTSINNQIFNSPYIINSDNNYLDKSYKAKLIDQFFLFNGKGFLTEINGNYKFQLVEQSKDFFDELNKDINQLDFESDDFVFNQTSYNNLKLQSSSVWIWPIVCMHEKKISSKTRFQTGDNGLKFSRPCFNYSVLLKKIFEVNNWNINYDDNLIDFLAISANAKQFFVTSYQKTLNETIIVSGSTNIQNLDTNDFIYNISVSSTYIDIGNIKTAFRLRGEISTENDVKIIFRATDNAGTPNIVNEEFVITSDMTNIDLKTDFFETEQTSNQVQIIIEGDSEVEFTNTFLYTIIEEADLGDFNNNALIGYKVKVYDNLPEKKQIDILRDALILTNSIIIPDSFTKVIELKTLKNLSKLNSYDWSDKFDYESETITNELNNYAKKNYLKYDNDDTLDSKTGQSYFNIYNENIIDETDLITLNYSASKEVNINNYTLADWPIYSDTTRVNELTNRLIYFYTDIGELYTIGKFADLDWNVLKLEYYKNWFDSLYRLRIIEGLFNLNKLDVLGFDFTKTVYIKKLNSYFFVLDIKNFVPNKKTRVKLIKFL